MTLPKGLEMRPEQEERSLCSFSVGDGLYGIDTRRIREVLGARQLHPVPMAPGFVAGVVSYRGEVLTTVSFRVLLGMERERAGGSCVLVLEEEGNEECFGLVVDGVGGVATVSGERLEGNPGTLDARSLALFSGAYRMAAGLIVNLDPDRLSPGRLAKSELFGNKRQGEICGH